MRLTPPRSWLSLGLVLLAACGGEGADTEEVAVQEPVAVPATDVSDAPEPAPLTPREEAPEVIRGIYLNAYAAGSPNRLPKLIELADETEINAFVVDVKDERGIHYKGSEVALADEITPDTEKTIGNLEEFVDSLHAHDIYAIARVVLFKDPVLSKEKPEWSIQKPGGGLWVDKAGNTWVSAWDEEVWDYNLDIAEEVARAGFDEIQFDYVRFPEPYESLPTQVHPEAKGARTDAIAAFLNEAKRRLHPLGVVVAADVFGLSPNDPGDVGIGQQWETISSTADHILPMMYPSHYFPTHLPNVSKPNRMPYETLYKSAGMAVIRNNRLQEVGVKPARVIPWLQAFSAPWVDKNFPYGPEQAEAQIRGVHDVGLEDWIFWHPGSKYEQIADAFAKEAEPRATADYEPPADVLGRVELFEKQGIREARQRAAEQARGRTTDPEAAKAAREGEPVE